MASSPATTWRPRREGAPAAELLARFGPLLGQALWARGYEDPIEAERHLDPRLEQLNSPFRLHGMEEAAFRLCEAVRDNEPIVVYSDYDIDGMTGLSILVSFLRGLGHTNTRFYQPDRFSDGYGVHASALRSLAAEGARLIITVDTGISAFEAATEAKVLGLDLIITDHHLQSTDALPDTPYIVNPNQRADSSGLSYLSGAGIAFYLAVAARSLLRKMDFFASRPGGVEPDLRDLLDLLVLGTVADSVELRGDNRVLVSAGLKKLAYTRRPGLRALLNRLWNGESALTCKDIAFGIAPKLNAASRMGQAHLSTELLLTTDPGRAEELVEAILKLNDERSRVQSEVLASAVEQATAQLEKDDPPVLVVQGAWHEGVLGVVAAKLVEKFGKPSIVLTALEHAGAQVSEGLLRGSMRTLPKVHCLKVLEASREILVKFGGHRMAAGLQLQASRFKDFTETIWNASRQAPSEIFAPEPVVYDGELLSSFQTRDVVGLSTLGPWGAGNPEPLFRLRGLDPETKQVFKERHVRFRTPTGHTVIGFSKAEEVTRVQNSAAQNPERGVLEALVVPEINRFRGVETVQLRIEHVGSGSTPSPHPGPGRGFFEGNADAR